MPVPALLGRLWSLTFAILVCSTTALYADEPVLSRIAFGACAKQDKPQPIWDAVVESQPEAFLFLGDNIYGDTDDMAILKAKWQLLGAQPGYQKLKATCPIFATPYKVRYSSENGLSRKTSPECVAVTAA